MAAPIINLHNHTPFSDGAMTIDEICEAHLDADFDVAGVGICDTLFCTPTSLAITSEKQFRQVFRNEAREYASMVRSARRRWAGKLEIYCGCEIHWRFNRDYLNEIRTILTETGIEYVMVGALDWAGLTQLANQARRFPCPVAVARTNVAERFPSTSLDQVVRTMANARLIWEMTGNEFRAHDCAAWCNVLKNHRVRIAVGTDTHDDLRCIKDLPEMYRFLTERNLLDKIFVPEVREFSSVSA
ncbi:MAG: hypothetical protein AB7N71_02705 [Phycisphaerae bacterium]